MKGKVKGREGREGIEREKGRNIFHLLIHSPNVSNSRVRLGAKTPSWSLTWVTENQAFAPSFMSSQASNRKLNRKHSNLKWSQYFNTGC